MTKTFVAAWEFPWIRLVYTPWARVEKLRQEQANPIVLNALSAFSGYNGKELCLIVIDTFCLSKGARSGSESVTQNLLTTQHPKR